MLASFNPIKTGRRAYTRRPASLYKRATLRDCALFLFDLVLQLARGPQPQVRFAAFQRRRIDHHRIARLEAAFQHALRERVFDQVGDDAAQWPRAKGRVVAALREQVDTILAHLKRQAMILELLLHTLEHQRGNLVDLLVGQRMEDDCRVDTVEELGPE